MFPDTGNSMFKKYKVRALKDSPVVPNSLRRARLTPKSRSHPIAKPHSANCKAQNEID